MAIITISRGSMSGGEALAECLHQRLGYPVLGREVLVEAAAKLGVPEETLTQKFEKSPGLWSRLTESRRLYLVAIQAAIAEHAASGNLIYHGRAGHMLLHGVPNVLRVRNVRRHQASAVRSVAAGPLPWRPLWSGRSDRRASSSPARLTCRRRVGRSLVIRVSGRGLAGVRWGLGAHEVLPRETQ